MGARRYRYQHHALENVRHDFYYLYGAQGVRICKRWRKSFEAFLLDMGKRPSSDHTLHRKNGKRLYCKRNCKWATWKEQNRDRNFTRQQMAINRWYKKWYENNHVAPQDVPAEMNLV